ncbi:MAG TPA: hypothetical protein V6C57_00040 [Coleofasciculaceae cyanobacterium]
MPISPANSGSGGLILGLERLRSPNCSSTGTHTLLKSRTPLNFQEIICLSPHCRSLYCPT